VLVAVWWMWWCGGGVVVVWWWNGVGGGVCGGVCGVLVIMCGVGDRIGVSGVVLLVWRW